MNSDWPQRIRGSEVHLWLAMRGDLAPDAPLVAALNNAERARASHLRNAADRALFVLAHAVLRDVLARHLGCDPGELLLDSGRHGRPMLAAVHDSPLEFNLSHSGDAVLIAVAQGRAVGADIEAVVSHDDLDTVAAQVFSDDECAALAAQDANGRVALFHALWTRKEACLKAWGRGLGVPTRSFSVLAARGTGIRCPDGTPNDRLSCRSVIAPPGYAAAIAVSGEFGDVVSRRWRNAP